MRELIDKGPLADAHPSQWAPFVVVGEGSAPAITMMPSSNAHGPEKNLPAKAQIQAKKKPVVDWGREIWR
jgi:hypothetical protein